MAQNGMERFALAVAVCAGILLAQAALSADEEGAPETESAPREERTEQMQSQAKAAEQLIEKSSQVARESAEKAHQMEQQPKETGRATMQPSGEPKGPAAAGLPKTTSQQAGPWGDAGRESLDRRRAWIQQNRDAWRRLRNPRGAYMQDVSKARRAMMRGLAADRRANRDAFSPPVGMTAPPLPGGPHRPW